MQRLLTALLTCSVAAADDDEDGTIGIAASEAAAATWLAPTQTLGFQQLFADDTLLILAINFNLTSYDRRPHQHTAHYVDLCDRGGFGP
jgi:hypothetical protein